MNRFELEDLLSQDSELLKIYQNVPEVYQTLNMATFHPEVSLLKVFRDLVVLLANKSTSLQNVVIQYKMNHSIPMNLPSYPFEKEETKSNGTDK